MTARMRVVLSVLVLAGVVVPATEVRAERAVGWVVECRLSHRLRDDPIVYPGQPGASHLHDFFGNRTTAASSTYETLVASGTTCSHLGDTSAYWTPTLRVRRRRVVPTDFDFYYINITTPHAATRSFPPGLRVIAGNSAATAPQGLQVIQWLCDGGEERPVPPRRCGDKDLVARIKFPDCWDGVNLDSPNHRSHMAYSYDADGDGTDAHVCPATHPTPVPKLIYRIQWPVHLGRRVRLSAGPHYRLHADFINSWDQATLDRLVQECINAGVHCGRANFDDD